MNPFGEKRSGTPLTDNEKLMIINVYMYLSDPTAINKDHQKLTLRKRASLVLGIAESNVGKVLSDWNQRNDGSFSPNKPIGRAKVQPSEDIALLLNTKILESNSTGRQLSTSVLRKHLSKNGYDLSKWQLLRVLHHLGYYYGRSERRNMLHESPNNVAFRCKYIRRRFENLEGENDVAHLPEIFIDESYCHLHHNSPNTWLPHHGIISVQGRGPLLVIFGAIAVFQNGGTNKVEGEAVSNSVHILDPTIKPPGSKGRKRNDAEAWNNIPNFIKNTKYSCQSIRLSWEF